MKDADFYRVVSTPPKTGRFGALALDRLATNLRNAGVGLCLFYPARQTFRMELEVRPENRELFESRPHAWVTMLLVDRLEVPLAELLERADCPLAPEIAARDCRHFFEVQVAILASALEGLQNAVDGDMQTALNIGENPGGAMVISEACARILSFCRIIAGVEGMVLRAPVAPKFFRTRQLFAGVTAENLGQLSRFVCEVRGAVERDERGILRFDPVFAINRPGLAVEEIPGKVSAEKPERPSAGRRCFSMICFWIFLAFLCFLGVPFWALVGIGFLRLVLSRCAR